MDKGVVLTEWGKGNGTEKDQWWDDSGAFNSNSDSNSTDNRFQFRIRYHHKIMLKEKKNHKIMSLIPIPSGFDSNSQI